MMVTKLSPPASLWPRVFCPVPQEQHWPLVDQTPRSRHALTQRASRDGQMAAGGVWPVRAGNEEGHSPTCHHLKVYCNTVSSRYNVFSKLDATGFRQSLQWCGHRHVSPFLPMEGADRFTYTFPPPQPLRWLESRFHLAPTNTGWFRQANRGSRPTPIHFLLGSHLGADPSTDYGR